MDKDRISIIALQQTKLTKTDYSQAKTSHKLLRDQPLNVQRREFDIFLKLYMSGWHESFRLASCFIATIYNIKTQKCSSFKPKKKKWTHLCLNQATKMDDLLKTSSHAAHLVLFPVINFVQSYHFIQQHLKLFLHTYIYWSFPRLVNVASVILVILLFRRNLQARQSISSWKKKKNTTTIYW